MFDIDVKIPKLSSHSEKFRITEDGIYFGVKDVKSLTGVTGDKAMKAISDASEELGKHPSEFTWLDVLTSVANKINSTAFKALASIGFFSTKATGVTRNRALYEYLIFRELTKAELTWIQKNYPQKKWSSLQECFSDLAPTKKLGGGTSNVNRSQIVTNEIEMLKSPPPGFEEAVIAHFTTFLTIQLGSLNKKTSSWVAQYHYLK